VANIKRANASGITKTGTAISDVPDAPTIGTVSFTGTTTASIPFTAAATGGSPTSYVVAATPTVNDLSTNAGTSSPRTATGTFVASTAYTFTIRGVNSTATGPVSAASNSVTAISNNFFANVAGSNTDDQGFGVAIDSSGNVYIANYSNGARLTKFDNTGTLQWQRTYEQMPNNYYNNMAVGVDSSNNPYLSYQFSSGGNYHYQVIKWNSSGTLQWRSDAVNVGGRVGDIADLKFDSSGNIYISAGHDSLAGGYDGWIAKFNSSGVLQSQYRLNANNDVIIGFTVHQSNGNMYAVGQTNGMNSDYNGFVFKLNSSFSKVWARQLQGTSGNTMRMYAVVTDSSENVYAAGHGGVSGTNHMIIAKWNSSGTIQWQRKIAAPSASIIANGIDVDSSGNVYVCGWTDGISALGTTGGIDGLLVKYDSSGNLQWQRKIYSATGGVNESLNGIVIDNSTSSIYGTGYADGGAGTSIVFRVPTDGSLTGTYSLTNMALNSITYAASTMTESANNMTESAETSLAISTTSFATATISSASNTTSPTAYKVNL